MNVSVRRARPVLGTLVEFCVEGQAEPFALAAIDDAFREVQMIHALMSFHEADSDLAKLHRAPVGEAVAVDARTREALAMALEIATASDGWFDPTIAAQQVAWGFLPRPDSPFTPDARADWRDVELLDSGRVRLRKPLWLDLGGIAKGYAVDRAVQCLLASGIVQGLVNAGGDLRVFGPHLRTIHLDSGDASPMAAVNLGDASIASSRGMNARRRLSGCWVGPHVRGRGRRAATTTHGVSVVAERCIVADALTKVVLSGDRATTRRVLSRFAASACVYYPRRGWELVEGAA